MEIVCSALNDTQRALVMSALGTAERLARRYTRRHMPLKAEDLYMAAVDGLMTAALRYDPARRVPFSAFARPYAWRAVLHAIRDEVRLGLGVSNYQQDRAARARTARAEIEAVGGDGSARAVAKRLGVTEAEAEKMLAPCSRVIPLESMKETPDPGAAMVPLDTLAVLQAVEKLPRHLRRIVRAVYLEGRPPEEVAARERMSALALKMAARGALKELRGMLSDGQTGPRRNAPAKSRNNF